MKISINGEQFEFPGTLTVAGLLEQLQTPERGVAVAVNDRVVRRSAFEQEPVNEGDRIEIIRAVAGG